jgi:hypothetical protein
LQLISKEQRRQLFGEIFSFKGPNGNAMTSFLANFFSPENQNSAKQKINDEHLSLKTIEEPNRVVFIST